MLHFNLPKKQIYKTICDQFFQNWIFSWNVWQTSWGKKTFLRRSSSMNFSSGRQIWDQNSIIKFIQPRDSHLPSGRFFLKTRQTETNGESWHLALKSPLDYRPTVTKGKQVGPSGWSIFSFVGELTQCCQNLLVTGQMSVEVLSGFNKIENGGSSWGRPVILTTLWLGTQTTDAQRWNSLHCMTKKSLPLPNF